MLFEPQKPSELDALRRKGLALSAVLHVLLFLFLAVNPDFFSATSRRVVRVEGEDYDEDRFDVVELVVPPDLAAPPPVVDLPQPEFVIPAPEVEATPPPEEIAEPEPELAPIPPPPVIGPDDVIADGARPDAPPEPSQAPQPAELQPPTPEAGGIGDEGDGGDGGDGDDEPPVSAQGAEQAEPLVEIAENTNPNALVLPNLRRQAESLIEETVAQNPRSGTGSSAGDILPNLTTDNPEILSDTRGYDFGPYMNQVINRVRTNWYSLIPEAARIGTLRGRVIIVFTITESGRIENLRAVGPSGSSPLDRAAVAAIQASNPFPDLPSDFDGDRLVLQFAFLYNLPRSSAP